MIPIIITPAVLSKDPVVLEELCHPKHIMISGERIFVTEYPHIFIYSMKDFRLIKKFGERGAGPGEFYIDEEWMDRKIMGLVSSVLNKTMYVNSMGRLSLFSLDGKLITSHRTHPFQGGYYFRPLNETSYIGFKVQREETSIYLHLNRYNRKLIKEKTLYQVPFWIRDRNTRSIDFFERANGSLQVQVYQSRIYIAHSLREVIKIDVLDSEGKKIRSISHESERIPVTEKFIAAVHRHFKLKFKRGLEANIKRTVFGNYFPAIRQFRVTDNKIYIFTYWREEQRNDLVVMDLQGKVLTRKMILLKEKNPEHLYPFTIWKNRIYQLSENIEDESWELNMIPIL